MILARGGQGKNFTLLCQNCQHILPLSQHGSLLSQIAPCKASLTRICFEKPSKATACRCCHQGHNLVYHRLAVLQLLHVMVSIGTSAPCREDGKIAKTLKLNPLGEKGDWYLGLEVKDSVYKENSVKLGVPLSRAELHVIRNLSEVTWPLLSSPALAIPPLSRYCQSYYLLPLSDMTQGRVPEGTIVSSFMWTCCIAIIIATSVRTAGYSGGQILKQ